MVILPGVSAAKVVKPTGNRESGENPEQYPLL